MKWWSKQELLVLNDCHYGKVHFAPEVALWFLNLNKRSQMPALPAQAFQVQLRDYRQRNQASHQVPRSFPFHHFSRDYFQYWPTVCPDLQMAKNQFDRSFAISRNPKTYQTNLSLHCHFFYQAYLPGINHSYQSYHYRINDQRLEHARSPNSASSLNESVTFSGHHVL